MKGEKHRPWGLCGETFPTTGREKRGQHNDEGDIHAQGKAPEMEREGRGERGRLYGGSVRR